MTGSPASPRLARARYSTLAALLGWLTLAPLLAASSFKISVEHDAAYRVSFEDLTAAGLAAASLESASLGLTCAGEGVPIWVADGGDGTLGPGDWFEFVGEHLRGEVSYFDEHSRYNVYVLASGAASPARMLEATTDAIATPSAEYRRRQHLEEDLLLLRLPASGSEDDELWYGAKLVFNAKKPYTRGIDLSDLAECPGCDSPHLTIALRGWSKPRVKPDPEMADHRVEVAWNGNHVATAEWNGTRPYRLDIPDLQAADLVRGQNVLELSVPRRRPEGASETLIDVSMLNWIEISYPRDNWVGEQAHLTLVAPAPAGRLRSKPGRELVAYGSGGSRSVAVATATPGESVFTLPPGESSWVVAASQALQAPAAVVFDQPSYLRDPQQQVDYIMITHRTLLAAIEPLADLHRSRGLEVEVVDLQDVYDEFHHGIAHPVAIRSFLQYAHETWQSPAPRFVLLVGDASWDARNARAEDSSYADWTYRPGEKARFSKNTSSPYAEDAELNRRGLVPTWDYATYEGHSASDNFFVAFAEDDSQPAMAIGRLPVVEPKEVAQIVAKALHYATAPEVGPWRRNALLITNESTRFQRQSDGLANQLAAAGFGSQKIYPASSETSNERHTERLIEAFDEGQLLVHFLGHGGRYIWRTGPPDIEKNHDLFTLEHLEQLTPGGRLPIVLSLTCYSAPFDHPNADSIGEKLLRLEGRGAIAVFAASWRNSPRPQWGQVLIEEMTRAGTTIGEAVMRAKQRIKSSMFVETYNLLGDPALPVALPTGKVALELSGLPDGPLHIQGEIGVADFDGEVLVEAVDDQGNVLTRSTFSVPTPDFALDLELGDELDRAQAILAYAWDTKRNVDAAGAFELDRAAESSDPESSTGTRP